MLLFLFNDLSSELPIHVDPDVIDCFSLFKVEVVEGVEVV
jgi:hypothetical protein